MNETTNSSASNAQAFMDAALYYASKGMRVLPLYSINHEGHCTCSDGKGCSSPGKHPKTKNGFKDATTDIEQIKKWWPVESVIPSNIGIATGGEIGLVVIDVDGNEGFEALGDERVADLKDESVPCVSTGRGYHYYFRSSTPLKTERGFVKNVDIKGEGGYIVAPPSRHVSGRCYEWLNGEFSLNTDNSKGGE